MTRNVEGPAPGTGETFAEMPTTGSDGEAEHRTNGHGGQAAVIAFRPVPVGNRRSWQEHAMLVSVPWRRSVQDYFETGDALEEALKELDPPDYRKMLAEVGIDAAEARKLRLISKNQVLRVHAHALPRDYTTMFLLSQIAGERLEVLFADEIIHRDLKRWQAENLKDDECGDRYRPQQKRAAARAGQQSTADTAEQVSDDADGDESAADEGGEEDDQPDDPERIVADADYVAEAFRETLGRHRRTIEQVRLHAELTTCDMLGNELIEIGNTVARLGKEMKARVATANVGREQQERKRKTPKRGKASARKAKKRARK